jgi:hypothetical protein
MSPYDLVGQEMVRCTKCKEEFFTDRGTRCPDCYPEDYLEGPMNQNDIAKTIAQLTADAEYCEEMRSGSNNPEYWAESYNAIREQIANWR